MIAVYRGFEEIVHLLAENPNCHINKHKKDLQSGVLWQAAKKHRLEIFKYLLTKGADINQPDKKGNYIYEVYSGNGNLKEIMDEYKEKFSKHGDDQDSDTERRDSIMELISI
jgi:ankyrin repeat protein